MSTTEKMSLEHLRIQFYSFLSTYAFYSIPTYSIFLFYLHQSNHPTRNARAGMSRSGRIIEHATAEVVLVWVHYKATAQNTIGAGEGDDLVFELEGGHSGRGGLDVPQVPDVANLVVWSAVLLLWRRERETKWGWALCDCNGLYLILPTWVTTDQKSIK